MHIVGQCAWLHTGRVYAYGLENTWSGTATAIYGTLNIMYQLIINQVQRSLLLSSIICLPENYPKIGAQLNITIY